MRNRLSGPVPFSVALAILWCLLGAAGHAQWTDLARDQAQAVRIANTYGV